MSARPPTTAAQGIVKVDEGPARYWELTYYLHCTEAEAQRIYDAFQVLLCSCENHGEDSADQKHCRVPFSGMKPPSLIPDEDTGAA